MSVWMFTPCFVTTTEVKKGSVKLSVLSIACTTITIQHETWHMVAQDVCVCVCVDSLKNIAMPTSSFT